MNIKPFLDADVKLLQSTIESRKYTTLELSLTYDTYIKLLLECTTFDMMTIKTIDSYMNTVDIYINPEYKHNSKKSWITLTTADYECGINEMACDYATIIIITLCICNNAICSSIYVGEKIRPMEFLCHGFNHIDVVINDFINAYMKHEHNTTDYIQEYHKFSSRVSNVSYINSNMYMYEYINYKLKYILKIHNNVIFEQMISIIKIVYDMLKK